MKSIITQTQENGNIMRTSSGSFTSNFKQERIKDEKYREFIRDLSCSVPRCTDYPCDAAHVRSGHAGGMGLKPPDDLLHPLCRRHHREQTDWPLGEADWWMERVIKPQAKLRYKEWKERQ